MQVTVLTCAEAAGALWDDAARPAHLPDDLVAALMAAGLDARLVVLPPPEPATTCSPYAATAATGQWVAEHAGSADVVHALDPCAAAAALAARTATGVPVVVRWPCLPETDDPAVRRARLAVLHAADAVLCPAEPLARHVRVAAGERVGVVPDGVDTSAWGPPPSFTEHGQTLVTLSGASAATGTVLAALRMLPGARLVVAGRGDAGGLLRQAERLGVGDQVTVAGWLPRSQAVGLVDAADVVVAPRPAPTSGASAVEAMCRARVVVAADVPVVRDVVVDRGTGLLVPPDDVVALAGAVQALLADPFRREAWGVAGAERAAGVYDWSVVLPRLEAVYARVVAAGPARSPLATPGEGCSTGQRWSSSSRYRNSPARPTRGAT